MSEQVETNPLNQLINTKTKVKLMTESGIINTKPTNLQELSPNMFFNNSRNGFAPQYNVPLNIPEIYVHITNRKLMINKQDVPQKLAFKKYTAEFFGQPAFVNIDASTTGRELYELIWMRIRYMLK